MRLRFKRPYKSFLPGAIYNVDAAVGEECVHAGVAEMVDSLGMHTDEVKQDPPPEAVTVTETTVEDSVGAEQSTVEPDDDSDPSED